jgi:hypothetical protein
LKEPQGGKQQTPAKAGNTDPLDAGRQQAPKKATTQEKRANDGNPRAKLNSACSAYSGKAALISSLCKEQTGKAGLTPGSAEKGIRDR